MVKIQSVHVEWAFLAVVFSSLLWFGIGPVFDHLLVHEYPRGYLASDAFWHLVSARYVYSEGNYNRLPFYLGAGYTDVVGFQPPLLFHLTAMLSHLTGLPVHDSMFLLTCLFMIGSAFMMYFVIRNFNIHVAVLAIPITIFIFCRSFYLGYLWGEVNFYVGSFFLVTVAYFLTKDPQVERFFLLGIILGALATAHTSEYIFGLGLLVVHLAVLGLQHRVNKDLLRNLALAVLVGIILSWFYLTVFAFTFGAVDSASYASKLFTVVKSAGFRIVQLSEFGLVLVPLGVGLAIWVFLRQRLHNAFVFAIYMLLVGLTNYIGLETRSFQARFLWPVYLSVFFGLSMYYLPKLIVKKIPFFVSALFSVALFFVLANAYYSPINHEGLMNRYHWDAFTFLQGNAELDADVLIFYGEALDQTGQTPLVERKAYQIKTYGYEPIFKTNIIPRDMESDFIYNSDIKLAYRKSLFDYGYHFSEENMSRVQKRDICQFDYLVIDKFVPSAPVIGQLNNIIIQELQKSPDIEKVHENELTLVLKNKKPGHDCIPKEGIRLQ